MKSLISKAMAFVSAIVGLLMVLVMLALMIPVACVIALIHLALLLPHQFVQAFSGALDHLLSYFGENAAAAEAKIKTYWRGIV